MTITYAQLDHLNLSRLDHALTAWKEVVRKMKEEPTGLRCAVGAVVCCHTRHRPLPGL
ncbi:hypothetical protein OG250_24970 [Streptomyces sp. NBC_00487]|uniref:hypothetical protein n=1 Tax=unclassified Streptomyces TaxID=2593676 RepID=UPI002E18F7E2|nr:MULTISPECIES: hypothetical protein [unclassified Streptomyces]